MSHDVHEIGAIADYSYLLSEGKVVAEGSPARAARPSHPRWCKQFMSGAPDGPVPFHYPARDYFAAAARTAGECTADA